MNVGYKLGTETYEGIIVSVHERTKELEDLFTTNSKFFYEVETEFPELGFEIIVIPESSILEVK